MCIGLFSELKALYLGFNFREDCRRTRREEPEPTEIDICKIRLCDTLLMLHPLHTLVLHSSVKVGQKSHFKIRPTASKLEQGDPSILFVSIRLQQTARQTCGDATSMWKSTVLIVQPPPRCPYPIALRQRGNNWKALRSYSGLYCLTSFRLPNFTKRSGFENYSGEAFSEILI